ncbi:hypothetical protein FACS18949_00090 [Clostridia bacterium]|nr:hypothetical protein FACS18949_00090 [Clostridia bacterium]
MRKFDRFCETHEHWGLKNLMLFVVICNGLVMAASMFNPEIPQFLAFNWEAVAAGQVWRVLTFMFIPLGGSNIIFTLIALWFYYWVGSTLERSWGRLKFTIFYLTGMLATILYCVLTRSGGDATYLNLSLFLAFATLFPEMRILLFFVIPIKVKWLGIAEAVLMFGLPLLAAPTPAMRFFPLVAVLNYCVYFYPYWRGVIEGRRGSGNPNVINFKKAAKKVASVRQPQNAAATHRCAVCGLTNLDDPNMEFRYCSLCARYECYCSNHLFTHEHTKGDS